MKDRRQKAVSTKQQATKRSSPRVSKGVVQSRALDASTDAREPQARMPALQSDLGKPLWATVTDHSISFNGTFDEAFGSAKGFQEAEIMAVVMTDTAANRRDGFNELI
jgi:hypothetical protein